jgi:hypothetical protein
MKNAASSSFLNHQPIRCKYKIPNNGQNHQHEIELFITKDNEDAGNVAAVHEVSITYQKE